MIFCVGLPLSVGIGFYRKIPTMSHDVPDQGSPVMKFCLEMTSSELYIIVLCTSTIESNRVISCPLLAEQALGSTWVHKSQESQVGGWKGMSTIFPARVKELLCQVNQQISRFQQMIHIMASILGLMGSKFIQSHPPGLWLAVSLRRNRLCSDWTWSLFSPLSEYRAFQMYYWVHTWIKLWKIAVCTFSCPAYTTTLAISHLVNADR